MSYLIHSNGGKFIYNSAPIFEALILVVCFISIVKSFLMYTGLLTHIRIRFQEKVLEVSGTLFSFHLLENNGKKIFWLNHFIPRRIAIPYTNILYTIPYSISENGISMFLLYIQLKDKYEYKFIFPNNNELTSNKIIGELNRKGITILDIDNDDKFFNDLNYLIFNLPLILDQPAFLLQPDRSRIELINKYMDYRPTVIIKEWSIFIIILLLYELFYSKEFPFIGIPLLFIIFLMTYLYQIYIVTRKRQWTPLSL